MFSLRWTLGIVGGLLAAQVVCATTLRTRVADRELLPPVPSSRALDAAAFGDRQFLFRVDSLQLQNGGDTGGRIVPVKNYDFGIVVGWLRTLQDLDSRSVMPVELASGYFGFSQETAYLRPIVDFIRDNVALSPETRWKYLFQ